MTLAADKNLGGALCEPERYDDKAWDEHLGHETTYRVISPTMVHAKKVEIRCQMDQFLSEAFRILPENEKIYFRRLKEKVYDRVISKFYLTAKVHKTPWKTRPVVATCGTFLHGLSRWSDVYLQQLKDHSPTYLRDSYHMLEELDKVGELPEGSKLFTMDATSMYTNIDTDHGLDILEKFIEMFEDLLPKDFPKELLLWSMKIIMRFNVFEFGSHIIQQLCGTAMGTPCACMYATIYYCYHEICVLLAKYERYLILYKRLIDDGCGIWNDRGDLGAWDRFCYDVNNFVGGKLKWVIDERCEEVNFLDITIRINELNRIETRTYQKPMNLYLYITDNSAHPPGVMKGMIFGELKRYHRQNTRREDYLEMVRLLFLRLRARGWRADLLREWFIAAAERVEAKQPTRKTEDVSPRDRLFLHLKYHPRGITRQQLRAAFDATCDSFNGTSAAVKQVTVAFSRARNLKDALTSARFRPPEHARGPASSTRVDRPT